jgi:O-antigen/teichoic acid export membrane protein
VSEFKDHFERYRFRCEACPAPALQKPRAIGVLRGLGLTPERARAWGVQSGLSIMDQGLISGSGFILNLLLARWLPAENYGAFAVAFAVFLFASGFHNVLLLEPMCVFGPSSYSDRLHDYFRSQLKVHAVLVGPLSGLILLSAAALMAFGLRSALTSALIGSAVALPFLLLLWLVRRMCYVVQRPFSAVMGSVFYFVMMVAGLLVLPQRGVLNPFTAFLLVAAASTLASALLLYQHGIFGPGSEPQGSAKWKEVFRENWRYGRWLLGSAVLFPAVSQTQIILSAALLGLGATGVLRAMQLPSLLMTQVITATGLLSLPVLSRDFGRGAHEHMRGKALLVSLGLVGMAVCLAALLVLAAGRVEVLLFGGKYAAYSWLMPALALIPVVTAASLGYSMVLRASQKPQFDLLSNVIAAPIALLSAVCFIQWWGLAGAAASMVLGFVAQGAVTIMCFRQGEWGAA